VGRLQDSRGRTGARHAKRLAGEHGVVLVGPHVELLDLVPELGLVDRPVGGHARRELAVLRLVRVLAALHLVRRAAARWKDFGEIPGPVFTGRTPAAPATTAPYAAQIGMAVRHARRRHIGRGCGRALTTATSLRERERCRGERN